MALAHVSTSCGKGATEKEGEREKGTYYNRLNSLIHHNSRSSMPSGGLRYMMRRACTSTTNNGGIVRTFVRFASASN